MTTVLPSPTTDNCTNTSPSTTAAETKAMTTTTENGTANGNADDPAATTTTTSKGVAGRINYAQWDKVTSTLVQQTEEEEEAEKLKSQEQLGLTPGKYARSQAEAEEQEKFQKVQAVKQKLQTYQKREEAVVMTLSNLFDDGNESNQNRNNGGKCIRRVTRQDMDAGTRVLRIVDTTGPTSSSANPDDATIVLTQDLCHLESKMAASQPVNPNAKSYQEDAENDVDEKKETEQQQQQQRSIFGLIKVFLQNISNCTILIKCKLISGTLEMHHCHNVVVKVMGPHATVATVQMDLSQHIHLEFHDAPSGENVVRSSSSATAEPTLFWGQDKDDRIFHAGVQDLTVRIYRDGMLDLETKADYLRDGAKAVGNATAEEMQFVTSVVVVDNVDPQLLTEVVARTGSTTGQQVRAMTERELQAEKEQRERAAKLAMAKAEEMIQIKDKHGNPIVTKQEPPTETTNQNNNTTDVQEVLSPQVQAIVDECEQNKTRGNEAFGMGEYGQAILLYSLALDKAEELPSNSNNNDSSPSSLFPRDVVYSNRAACFLKLGQPEKALEDTKKALQSNDQNIKALFRQGLALHAQQQYQQALPYLVQASKLEPKNKQIQQALKFCEVRLEQEFRKRQNQ